MEDGLCNKSNEQPDIARSEPGAVATGQRINLKTDGFCENTDHQTRVFGRVATALGSDVEHFLCKAGWMNL